MQGNIEATVTIGLSPDQVTSIFILFAYQEFTSDPRYGGPETFKAFSEALTWAAGKVLRAGDGEQESETPLNVGRLFDGTLRARQEQLAEKLFDQYAQDSKVVGTREEAREVFTEAVAPYLTWQGIDDPVLRELVAIRALLEQRPAINITLGESGLTDSMLASFLANKSGVGRA